MAICQTGFVAGPAGAVGTVVEFEVGQIGTGEPKSFVSACA